MLSERVRLLDDEQNYANNRSGTTINPGSDWADCLTQSVTLAKDQLIAVKFQFAYGSGSNQSGHARVLVDGKPVYAIGEVASTAGKACNIVVAAPAGTYDVKIQVCDPQPLPNGSSWNVTGCYIGKVNFSDLVTYSWDVTDTVLNGQTKTVFDQTKVLPAMRVTCLGNIKKYNVFFLVYMQADDYRASALLNAGEGDVAGKMNWKLYKDGSQTSWTERANDYGTYAGNLSYGEGAFGRYYDDFAPETSLAFRVDAYNNTGADRNVTVNVRMIICPWILLSYSDVEPLDLAGGQLSTTYVSLEPLDLDPTKYVKLGKTRCVTFGDSTDFYSTASGTGVVNWSYTFENVTFTGCPLLVWGLGGCVSMIGLDIR